MTVERLMGVYWRQANEGRIQVQYSAADLEEFENEIEAEFNAGEIRSPVHLAGGNAHQLIELFKEISPHDWVLCSWRSHFHCLLKGAPPDEVRAAILMGRSIALCFPKYHILSSAIVGGICPIATGIGWSIKQRGTAERVICFIGDMTAETGIYYESAKYCEGHGLPVKFIIEDNGKSVKTDTTKVWGGASHRTGQADPWRKMTLDPFPPASHKPLQLEGRFPLWNTAGYRYELTREHVGTGKWVSL